MDRDTARSVKDSASNQWLDVDGICSVGLTKVDGEWALDVVSDGIPDWLPDTFHGLPIVVEDCPYDDELQEHIERRRPVLSGISIGSEFKGSCSNGFLWREGSRVYGSTNAHCVQYNGYEWEPGDRLVQPGRNDGALIPQDFSGSLVGTAGRDPNETNTVDFAWFDLDVEFIPEIYNFDYPLRGPTYFPDPGDTIASVGRTTGVSWGEVRSIYADSVVAGPNDDRLYYEDQLRFTDLDVEPGDSGSPVVYVDDGVARDVGILFATTTAFPIENVTALLDFEVVYEPAVATFDEPVCVRTLVT